MAAKAHKRVNPNEIARRKLAGCLHEALSRGYDGQDGTYFPPVMHVWVRGKWKLVQTGAILKSLGAEMAPTLNRWRMKKTESQE